MRLWTDSENMYIF